MKATLYIEGANQGGSQLLQKYNEQELEIQSLYKDIDVNSPPLAEVKFQNGAKYTLQLIDIRFIDDFVFIHCFVTNDNGDGGKALLRLDPK